MQLEIEKNLDFETVIALQATSCLRSKKNLDKLFYFIRKKSLTLFFQKRDKSPFYWQKKNKKLISNYNFKKEKNETKTKV